MNENKQPQLPHVRKLDTQEKFDLFYYATRNIVPMFNHQVVTSKTASRKYPLIFIFDTETTGLGDTKNKHDQIIEISALLFQDVQLSIPASDVKIPTEFNSIIALRPRNMIFELEEDRKNLSKPIIDPGASNVNGLTDLNMVKYSNMEKAQSKYVMTQFIDWLNNWKNLAGATQILLVSYSGTWFDPKFLINECAYAGVTLPIEYISFADAKEVLMVKGLLSYGYFMIQPSSFSNSSSQQQQQQKIAKPNTLENVFNRATGCQIDPKLIHQSLNDCKLLDVVIRYAYNSVSKPDDMHNILLHFIEHGSNRAIATKIVATTNNAHSRLKRLFSNSNSNSDAMVIDE